MVVITASLQTYTLVSLAKGSPPQRRLALVHPVHPARAKERRQRAGFLTFRLNAPSAAFSGETPMA